ncbi:putative nucleoporin Nup37 [Apostichopus japonicus]|uniref:Nucleoporin Nup37 n=1 Tax=Stichopus japonicus TaxID=307972 RepID=A0A2G8LB57_STIJA|nr:putative nucleoporin Nup37 [Apostichopus japonicus]
MPPFQVSAIMEKPTTRRAVGGSFETQGTVDLAEFSPSENSSSLIAYGGNLRVSLGSCVFKEEDRDIPTFNYQHIRDFHLGAKVRSIAWNPALFLDRVFKHLLCVAGDDNKLRVCSSDLRGADTIKVVSGHKGFINDVSFESTEGSVVASVGDDCRCRLWSEEFSQQTEFTLQSPGMSVSFNPLEPNKLMVAEKGGKIRFYDMIAEKPFMSLETGGGSLLSADWSRCNPSRVGAVVGGEWMIWDITRSSYPQDKDQAHPQIGRVFRWSKASPDLFATLGGPQHQAKIFHLGHHQIPICETLPVTGSLSWHAFLPICAVAMDTQVKLMFAET